MSDSLHPVTNLKLPLLVIFVCLLFHTLLSPVQVLLDQLM
jgi:hypothetical protein